MKTKNPVSELSLPPDTQDISYGRLKITIGQLYSLTYGSKQYPRDLLNYLLQFQIAFYGEKEATALRY